MQIHAILPHDGRGRDAAVEHRARAAGRQGEGEGCRAAELPPRRAAADLPGGARPRVPLPQGVRPARPPHVQEPLLRRRSFRDCAQSDARRHCHPTIPEFTATKCLLNVFKREFGEKYGKSVILFSEFKINLSFQVFYMLSENTRWLTM